MCDKLRNDSIYIYMCNHVHVSSFIHVQSVHHFPKEPDGFLMGLCELNSQHLRVRSWPTGSLMAIRSKMSSAVAVAALGLVLLNGVSFVAPSVPKSLTPTHLVS